MFFYLSSLLKPSTILAAPASTRSSPQQSTIGDAVERRSTHWRFDIVAAFVALVLIVLLHGSTVRAPLFADDYLFLDQVRHLSLSEALARPDPLGNFYRPLSRQVYFWFMGNVFGESP